MLQLRNLAIHAGAFRLDAIDLSLAAGEYGVLMGRTGAGKTSILEAIAGLRPSVAGRISIGGRDVTGLRPADRGVGYVPQDGALFQTMTVLENLTFALRIRRIPSVTMAVADMAERLGIDQLLDRMPAHLSGGERQRVALGRALVVRPALLLLDEPLSALDDDTRLQTHDLLRDLHRRLRLTVLHVTHHRGDAEALADAIYQLDAGHIRRLPIAPAAASPPGASTAPRPVPESLPETPRP